MWGHDIDNFLKDSQRLIPSHYNRIVQRLCDLVYNITHKPSNLEALMGKLLEKFPGMAFVNGSGFRDIKFSKVTVYCYV